MPRKCLNLKIGHVVPPFFGNHDKRYTLDVPVRCIYSTSSAFAALDAAGDVRCWGDCSSGGELDEQPQEVKHIFGNEAGHGQGCRKKCIGPKGQSQREFFFWGGGGSKKLDFFIAVWQFHRFKLLMILGYFTSKFLSTGS